MIDRQQLDQRRKAARIKRRQDLAFQPRHPRDFTVEPASEPYHIDAPDFFTRLLLIWLIWLIWQKPRAQSLGEPDDRLAYRFPFILVPEVEQFHITRLEEA